jgi:NTP pyrophosphatase (non-canonical NTP hydrolase)
MLDLQRDVHQNSVDHGFWEASDNIGEKLMLIVSEAAEALEAYRDGEMDLRLIEKRPDDVMKITGQRVAYGWRKPEGFPAEIADIVIRCMDLAGWLGFDLGAVVELKMAYNKTRPHLHGRKV